MSIESAVPTANASSGNPYVGLRPYERHERDLFFGRERDATMLRDKIFSARLTLYYGPSGVGKSSILKTLVIPLLEEEDAHAIYFDEWRGSEPLEALKARLVMEASEAGIPSPGAGAPTLAELAALTSSHTKQTLVLILDQFEEFLTVHSQHLDPLRRELGTLVRTPEADVRVVLSLRQEFLASLEPFRHEILTLFESTYRLEPLDDNAVREAIERPAQHFGKAYEPELVDLLIDEVREGGPEGSVDSSAPKTNRPVDLPTMQLVCSELWMAAQKKGDAPVLSRRLYAELGGKERILTNYVKHNMPRRWRDRCVTATLMRFLAPPSGLKSAYSVEDLAQYTAASTDRIRNELYRLASARILRTRGVHAGELFELQHDAFIGIIGPWRDDVLRQAAMVRRAKRTAGVLVAAVAVAGLVVAGQLWDAQRRELSRHLQAVAELRDYEGRALPDMASHTFEEVTRFLLYMPPCDSTSPTACPIVPIDMVSRSARRLVLWRNGNLETLKNLLSLNEGSLPERYGLPSADDLRQLAPDSPEWPFAVEYSPDGNLNEGDFRYNWREEAKSITKQWGIPVPLRLLLRADSALMPAAIRLVGLKAETQENEIPSFVKEVFIIAADSLPGPAKEFLKRFSSDRSAWTPFTAEGKRWWIVPRWSLPVWTVSKHRITNRSGFAARLVGEDVRRRPELLLVPEAAEQLLEHVDSAFPQTVKEARNARGDRLRQDLVAVVQRGRSIADDLPQLLDALAGYPREESHKVAGLIVEDVATSGPRAPPKANGPWRIPNEGTPAAKGLARSSSAAAYIEALSLIPAEGRSPLRVELGKGLVSRWRSGEEGLAVPLRKRLEEYHDGFARRYGLRSPGIRFRPGDGSTFSDMAFRVEVLGRIAHDSTPIVASQEDPIGTLMELVAPNVDRWRAQWLTAEEVASTVGSAEPALRDWLKAKYSVTDLKLLLRAVLASPPQSPPERSPISDQKAAPALPEQTLRYQNWLMRSLVFWSRVGDPSDIPLMSQRLRDTQRRRLNPPSSVPTRSATTLAVEGSIEALVNGKLDAAERGFDQAIKADRRGAIEAFLALYADFLPVVLVRQFGQVCQTAAESLPELEGLDLIDLDEAIRQTDFAKRIGADSARRLAVCVFATYSDLKSNERLALASQMLNSYSTVDPTTAGEASWVARKILADDDLVTNDTKLVQRAADLARKAVRLLPSDQRLAIVKELLSRCESPGPRNLCWTLASDLSIFVEDIDIQISLAWGLAARERKTDLERALAAVDRAARLVEKLPREEQPAAQDFVLLCRTEVLTASARLGDQNRGREAEVLLARLLTSPTQARAARVSFANVRRNQGRYGEAQRLLTGADSARDTPAYLYGQRLMLQLEQGDAAGVAATSDEVVRQWEKRPAGERLDMQYIGALGKTLTNMGGTNMGDAERLFVRQFLETTHQYVPYIALMLFASMAEKQEGEGSDLLRERWSHVKPETWAARLREGDEVAWREMLLGYYKGALKRDSLFGALENDRKYSVSPLRELPFTRSGLLTEAYFYDALLAQANKDTTRRHSSLEEVVRLNHRNYWEYSMAVFLLKTDRAGAALVRTHQTPARFLAATR